MIEIENPTEQQLFDHVLQALWDQGAIAIEAIAGGSCMYHTLEGKKCGIGHLLNEQEMKFCQPKGGSSMSIWRILNIPDAKKHMRPWWFEHSGDFFRELQGVHDNIGLNSFHANLMLTAKGFAKKYSLSDELIRKLEPELVR
jgi:hypothetical protein